MDNAISTTDLAGALMPRAQRTLVGPPPHRIWKYLTYSRYWRDGYPIYTTWPCYPQIREATLWISDYPWRVHTHHIGEVPRKIDSDRWMAIVLIGDTLILRLGNIDGLASEEVPDFCVPYTRLVRRFKGHDIPA